MAGNQFLYWIEGNPKQRVAPEVYVAFGVSKMPLLPTWKVWEVGKAPDVIMEVSSRSTASEDLGRKYALYQRLGVKEYFLIDVTREYLVESVVLYRLEGREYVQVLPEVVGEEWRGAVSSWAWMWWFVGRESVIGFVYMTRCLVGICRR